MKQRLRIAVLVIIFASVAIVLIWNHMEYSSATKHDTNHWAVIQDVDGSMLAIETPDNAVWNKLEQLRQNGTEMWIGGVVERYDTRARYRMRFCVFSTF